MLNKVIIMSLIMVTAGLQGSGFGRRDSYSKTTRGSKVVTFWHSASSNCAVNKQQINDRHLRQKRWEKEKLTAADCCRVTGIFLGIASYIGFMTWMSFPKYVKTAAK